MKRHEFHGALIAFEPDQRIVVTLRFPTAEVAPQTTEPGMQRARPHATALPHGLEQFAQVQPIGEAPLTVRPDQHPGPRVAP